MAEFLTTQGTSYAIEQIIIDAKGHLVLVSPYLQISKNLVERLVDAANRGVRITIIYGKDELKSNEKDSLSKLKDLELYFSENLHAKCYFNSDTMVVTSMNMYEFSKKNNREMGILIRKNVDVKLYEDAEKEVTSIKNAAQLLPIDGMLKVQDVVKQKGIKNTNQDDTESGVCIRCADEISLNPEKPYCGDCFQSWTQNKNEDYQEDFCHLCGDHKDTTIVKPFCYPCYKEVEVYC